MHPRSTRGKGTLALRSRSQDQNTDFSANPQGNAKTGEINSPPPGIMSNPDLSSQAPPQAVLQKMSENENLEKNAFSQGFSAEENSELILEPENVSLYGGKDGQASRKNTLCLEIKT